MENTYRLFGREYDESESILAERALTAAFMDMLQECGVDYGNDSPAWRESFHNWKDGLHRDGDICDNACNDLCAIGAQFD